MHHLSFTTHLQNSDMIPITQNKKIGIIGHSKKSNLLFVVHIYKENENTIRIISARKATKKEKIDFASI